jgi:hypothetical protein
MASPLLKQVFKKIYLVGGCLLIQTILQFAEANTTAPNTLAYSLAIDDNQNFYNEQDYNKIHSTDLSLTAKYTKDNFNYSLGLSLSQQNNLQQDTTLANTNLSMASKPFDAFFETPWQASYGVSLTLPTDQEQKRSTRYNGSFGLRGSLTRSLSLLNLPIDILYSLSGSKNFHEYDLNAEGRPLTEYSLKNRLGLDLSFTEKFSLSLLFDYINGLTYRQHAREKFATNLEIGYQLSKKISASLGIATDGSAKKANDFDSNISVFNANTSIVHSGVSLLF